MTSQLQNSAFSLDYANHAKDAPIVAGTRSVYGLALLTAVATFPLICMGGLVTSHHAGMSVPDWPNSYGYNMFLFPPNKWVGGILYEHTHRLMGTVVGMFAMALAVWSWRSAVLAPIVRRWVSSLNDWRPPIERYRNLSLWVLTAVIFQGVLGGLRVRYVNLDLAIVHACIAQAFFCLASLAVIVNSKWWQNAGDAAEHASGRGLVTLGIITVSVIYVQLFVGAVMRHNDAGLAIPDLPLAYGKILPPTNADQLATINHIRAFQMNLDPVTLSQVWLHFGHRIGAVTVSILVIALITKALGRHDVSGLTAPALILGGLVITQVTLGILTVALRKPADIASMHVAVGALVLATAFIITVRAFRLFGLRARVDVERATNGLNSHAMRTRSRPSVDSPFDKQAYNTVKHE